MGSYSVPLISRRNKTSVRVKWCVILLISVSIYLFSKQISTIPNNNDQLSINSLIKDHTNPTILLWKDPFGAGISGFSSQHCNQYCNFEIGHWLFGPSKQQIQEADAVIIHVLWSKGPSLITQLFTDTLEQIRKDGKLLIFLQSESPFYRFNRKPAERFFRRNKIEYSMTYKLDSSFPRPYGSIMLSKIKAIELSFKNTKPWLLSDFEINKKYRQHINMVFEHDKIQGAISLISNCKGYKRGEVIKFFDKYFKWKNGTKAIDVFGKCQKKYQPVASEIRLTSLKPSSHSLEKTSKFIGRYFFTLAFENSNCQDYITEKFFENAYVSGTVPVLMGQSRKTYQKHAPGESFVHIDDFEGDWGKLVKYLQYYIERPEEYRKKFFGWIDNGDSYNQTAFNDLKSVSNDFGVCKLCKVLKNMQSYDLEDLKHKDINNWWNNNACESYHDSIFS